jgi:hypothetical protein
MIGNANLAGGHDQELAPGKRLGVALQHGCEAVELGGQRRSRQPEEQDASMREILVEDQLAEVPVGNHQNTLLGPGNGQDILVSQAVRVIPGDGSYVVTMALQVVNEAKVSALIEQEPHTGVASAVRPFGGFGETSSPVTIAFA